MEDIIPKAMAIIIMTAMFIFMIIGMVSVSNYMIRKSRNKRMNLTINDDLSQLENVNIRMIPHPLNEQWETLYKFDKKTTLQKYCNHKSIRD